VFIWREMKLCATTRLLSFVSYAKADDLSSVRSSCTTELVSCVAAFGAMDSGEPRVHAGDKCLAELRGDLVPLLGNSFPKLITAFGVLWVSREASLELRPHMLNGIEVRGLRWPSQESTLLLGEMD
jgi:hypothetical protein